MKFYTKPSHFSPQPFVGIGIANFLCIILLWVFFRHLDDVEEDEVLAIGTTRAFTPTPSTEKLPVGEKGDVHQIQVSKRTLSASEV